MLQNSMRLYIKAWDGWMDTIQLKSDQSAPLLLRRRVSSLGQKALQSAWNIPGSECARYVFSSRHGEFGRTLSILTGYQEEGIISPADFSLSVHHALIGLLSIAQKNHHGHTALAAGNESLCFAFIEAYGLLQQNPEEDVLIIYCDEPLPPPFENFNNNVEVPVAMALLLSSKSGVEFNVSWSIREESHENLLSCHALDVLRFLQSDEHQITTHGERFNWGWAKHA